MSVYPEGVEVTKHAHVSADGVYRYYLRRTFAPAGLPWMSLAFIMLNPSTADAEQDDPTIRKCVGFARRLGYTGISVFNLYAFRATNPADLRRAMRFGIDVVGPENDERLSAMLAARLNAGSGVVTAWGAHAPDQRLEKCWRCPARGRCARWD